MTMDDMANFKTRKMNLTDFLQFVSGLVVIEVATFAHVREDAVASALADVECFPTSRIE